MGVIIYNGVSSEEFAIQVEHPPGYETPEKTMKLHIFLEETGIFMSIKGHIRTYQEVMI